MSPSPSTSPGRLLTVEEAAERLDTPVRFVRRLVAERHIPFHKIGRYVRIHTHDIDNFMAAGRVEPTVPRQRTHR